MSQAMSVQPPRDTVPEKSVGRIFQRLLGLLSTPLAS